MMRSVLEKRKKKLMTENNTFQEKASLTSTSRNTVKTAPPETERGNFWLWGGQSKFKLKTEWGRVRQCHLSLRQVNAPVMRVGQSPQASEHPHRHRLALVNEASLQLADHRHEKNMPPAPTGSWCAFVRNTPLILQTKDHGK